MNARALSLLDAGNTNGWFTHHTFSRNHHIKISKGTQKVQIDKEGPYHEEPRNLLEPVGTINATVHCTYQSILDTVAL
jgi:hypothetical protein